MHHWLVQNVFAAARRCIVNRQLLRYSLWALELLLLLFVWKILISLPHMYIWHFVLRITLEVWNAPRHSSPHNWNRHGDGGRVRSGRDFVHQLMMTNHFRTGWAETFRMWARKETSIHTKRASRKRPFCNDIGGQKSVNVPFLISTNVYWKGFEGRHETIKLY